MDKSAYALLLLAMLVALLAVVPRGVRWLQGRHTSPRPGDLRVVSAIAVGAQHKVVVVMLGSGPDQTQLVLGVGPQAIQCLHTATLHGVAATTTGVSR